jgi:FixJ family two-component response regulator
VTDEQEKNMSVSLQAGLFSRTRSRFQATQAPRRDSAAQLIPIDSPASSETIVHVVSNDEVQVSSLTKFFSSHSISVKAFRTANDYITHAESERIACVILDLNLPDISGLEVQNRLADQEGPPVLFVTAHGDLNSGVRAMKNGAIDFMVEPIDYNRLLAAVETAFAKDRHMRRERVERLSLLRRWNSLTPREQDVFQYTVAGFLNKQAAAELGITENTFQVHRGRVMRKMKADSLAELVRMSTRLESIAHSLTEYETSTQSLKAICKGLIEERSRGTSASTQARHSCTNRVSTPTFDRLENLRYAEIK